MTDTADDSTVEIATTQSVFSKRFGGWFWLLAATALLPSLVTVTGTSIHGLKWLHPELADVTKFEHLSLHWWSPIECSGLKISNTREWSRDAPPLLTAARIRTRKPLWLVAWNLGRGIDVTVTEPQLNLLNSKHGSNLRDAVEDLAGNRQSSETAFPFRAVVHDGSINMATPNAYPPSPGAVNACAIEKLVSGIQCDFSRLDTTSILPDVLMVARLGNDQSHPTSVNRTTSSDGTTVNPRVAARLEHLAADFQPLDLDPPNRDPASSDFPTVRIKLGPVKDSTQRAMRFVARGLKLDVLQPLIAQFVPGVSCSGLVSLQGEALMLGQSPSDGIAVRAVARAADVHWRQASWEPSETLQMSAASADLAVAVAKDGIVLQTLSLDCPFGKINGDGEIRLAADQLLQSVLESAQTTDVNRASVVSEAATAAAGQVNIRGRADLVALSRMLPRTLHLRHGLQLTEGAVRFTVRTQPLSSSDEGLQTLDWQAAAESSRIVARNERTAVVWNSPVRLECSGRLSMTAVKLRTAKLSGDFGEILARPTDDSLKVRGTMNFDRLWRHAGQFIDKEPPGIRGEVAVRADLGRPASGGIVLRDVELLADNLRVESKHLAVHTNRSFLKLLDGQLTLSGTGAAVHSLVRPWIGISWLDQESQVSVQLDAVPSKRLTMVAEIRPGGTASVSARPRHRSAALLINQAQIALDIDTDSQPDHYVIRSGRLRIPGVEAQLSGTLDTSAACMTTRMVIDADYDLEVLSRMLMNDPDGDFHLSGRRHSRITVRGAPELWDGADHEDTEPFEVTGEVGWDSADVCGLQLGPAAVPFRLKTGQLQTEPVRCSLNGGQLRAMLNYDLSQNSVTLAPGCRVENISVTQELSHQWLGYLSPFLADAADIQGSFSARASRFQYSLDHPESSDLSGTLDLRGITASPGNSLSVLLQALDTVRPGRRSLVRKLSVPPQQVRCELKNGVITHDQFRMTLSGYQLTSHGTVGLNRQLNLSLNMPLQKTTDQGSGKSVSVPVTGTVSRPTIDPGRLLRDAGTRMIQDEINNQLERGLNRLFDNRR